MLPGNLLIDPTNLDPQSATILSELLKQHTRPELKKKKTKTFHPNTEYTVLMPNPDPNGKPIEYKVKLTHDIIRRTSKHPITGRKKIRYSVISNKDEDFLGKGNQGMVVRLAGTLKHDKNGGVILKTNKNRVVKIMDKDLNGKFAKREYSLLKLLPNSHVKKVTQEKSKSRSYLVMEEFPGIPLTRVINADRAKNNLTLENRFIISINLAYALQEMHQRGVLHRDIKPDNILVNPKNCEVRIIDAGFGRKIAEKDGEHPGSLAYAAPELFTAGANVNEASDIYSLGLIFFDLWKGKSRDENYKNYKSKDEFTSSIKHGLEPATIPTFNLEGLLRDEQETLRCTLEGMTSIYQDHRSPLSHVTSELESAWLEYRLSRPNVKLNKVDKAKIKHANLCAQKLSADLRKLEYTPKCLPQIKTAIDNAVDSLHDTPGCIYEFIDILRIKAFNKCETKEDIKKTTKTILDALVNNLQQLINLSERISNEISLLQKSFTQPDAFENIKSAIDELFDRADNILDKTLKDNNLQRMDDFVHLNSILENGINAITTQLAALEKEPGMEKIPTYATIIQRLDTANHFAAGSLQQKISDIIKTYVQKSLISPSDQNDNQAMDTHYQEIDRMVTILENSSSEEIIRHKLTDFATTAKVHQHSIFAHRVGNDILTLATPTPVVNQIA